MFPEGIITRVIEVGPAFDLISGTPYSIKVMVSPTRSVVWGATNDPVIPKLKTYTIAANVTGEIPLPVTDQAGWETKSGDPIVLGPGDHAFGYDMQVFYLLNGSIVKRFPKTTVVLSTDDLSPVDIDTLVEYTDDNSGDVISVPDKWSAQVAAATAAAVAAAASAAEMEEALEDIDVLIEQEVQEYLTEHPVSAGAEYAFNSPLATWTIPHTLGRKPSVSVFVGGEEVLADVTASNTQVTITFATPQVGTATLI